jgi:hypothetical protein
VFVRVSYNTTKPSVFLEGFVVLCETLTKAYQASWKLIWEFRSIIRNLKKVSNSFQISKPFLGFVVCTKPFLSFVGHFFFSVALLKFAWHIFSSKDRSRWSRHDTERDKGGFPSSQLLENQEIFCRISEKLWIIFFDLWSSLFPPITLRCVPKWGTSFRTETFIYLGYVIILLLEHYIKYSN